MTNIFYILFHSLLRNNSELKRMDLLLLIFVLSPELLKILNPAATLDQPWLYRRYLYAVLPLGFLCLTIFIQQLRRSGVIITLVALFLISNIYFSQNIVFFKNNWGLNEKTKEDVVISRSGTLGYYYPGNYFTLQKGIVHMPLSGNTVTKGLDINNKTYDGFRFKRAYILSPDINEKYPGLKLKEVKSVKTEYQQLVPSCQLYKLKSSLGLGNVYHYADIPYEEVLKFCSDTENEIIEKKEDLYLFELNLDGNQN